RMADAQRHRPGAISSFSATNRDRERERRTRADLALDPDPPAVEFDELAAQGQPQPRALRLLLGRPHLAKLPTASWSSPVGPGSNSAITALPLWSQRSQERIVRVEDGPDLFEGLRRLRN